MRVVTASVMAVVLVLASTAGVRADGWASGAAAGGSRSGSCFGATDGHHRWPSPHGVQRGPGPGRHEGGRTAEGVPPAAAKALADLKDFLPRRSYQLLDTQWTMGQDRVVSRLQGGGRVYELELNAGLLVPGSVSVAKFVLKEVGSAATLGRGQEQDMAGSSR